MMLDRAILENRFYAKVKITPRCWLWIGAKCKGYGHMWDGEKSQYSAHLSYQWNIGPIPSGLTIDHICRNTSCVKPDHLQAVTMMDNILLGSKAQNIYCSRGHLYNDKNTYWYRTWRICRKCHCINEKNRNIRTGRTTAAKD
jgi:hypothetical protein